MRKNQNTVQKILPLFATLFVVVGIAAIVLSRPKDEPAAPPADATSLPPAATTGTITVLQTPDTGIRFLSDDGSVHECPSSWTDIQVRRLTQSGMDLTLSGGDSHHIGFDCTVTDVTLPQGMLSPSGGHGVRTGSVKSDGAGAVIFSDGKNDMEVVLRDSSSHPYGDPHVIGWLDDNRAAVVASKGDGRVALAVDSTGQISEMAPLPDGDNDAGEYAAANGAFWYVTITPGPGIEFGPRGPSEVHRVMGSDTVVAHDANNAVEQLTTGPNGQFSYVIAGTLYAGVTQGNNVGTGKSLGWTDDGTLMVARSGHLSLITPNDSSSTFATTDTQVVVPDNATAAFRVSLDGAAAAR